MNAIDVIFFQAELTPQKLAMIAQGAIIPYGRMAHGIVSAQQRLAAAGIGAGQIVGLNVAHPIDHFVLSCALHRLKAASAPMVGAVETYLDRVSLDAILTDSVSPLFGQKQPSAKIILVDPRYFQDDVAFSVADRSSSRREPDREWVARITCHVNDARLPSVIKITARALEAQLTPYVISAPSDWERMISVSGPHTTAGFLLGLSALWLGRTVCFADPASARNIIVAFRHHYLAGAAQDLAPLLRLQEVDLVAMPALRGAYVEGPAIASATMAQCLNTVSTNTLCAYSHPGLGIVAYGAANRLKDIEGAVGFVAPWAEAEILDGDRKPLTGEQAGELRIRAGGSFLPGEPPPNDGWIYPGQRARLLKGNLLVIRGTGA